MKSKHGGNREGAGRPAGSKSKKTIEQEQALEFLRQRIRDDWEGLIDSKIELAKGVYVMKDIKRGADGKIIEAKVYKTKPDSQSLEYLLSVVVGKPTEKIEQEITVRKGGIKEISDEELNRRIERIEARAVAAIEGRKKSKTSEKR